jgi:hypothetical protein
MESSIPTQLRIQGEPASPKIPKIQGADAPDETHLGGSRNPSAPGAPKEPEEKPEVPPSSSKVSIVDDALDYQRRGFSVIPLQDNKRPFFKWEPFQERRATEKEIRKWWREYPTAMIGIVCGAISGIVVVDIDDVAVKDQVKAMLPPELVAPQLALPIAKTPRGGWHLYFAHPGGTIGNATGFIKGVDFRGDGGYVVAPPSVTGSGGAYVWWEGCSIGRVNPPGLPETFKKSLLHNNYYSNKGGYGGDWGTQEKSVPPEGEMFTEGRRDNDIFHVANQLAKAGEPEERILQTVEKLAQSSDPPFPKSETRIKVQSALKRHQTRPGSVAEFVEHYISGTDGHFSSTDVYKAAQSSIEQHTPAQHQAAYLSND